MSSWIEDAREYGLEDTSGWEDDLSIDPPYDETDDVDLTVHKDEDCPF